MTHRIRPISEKSVDELLGYSRQPPLPTTMMQLVAATRRLPLRELSVEQLRLLIGQGEAVTYLLPLELEHLERDPLVEGRYWHGDLLQAVVRADIHWIQWPELRERIRAIIERALVALAANRPVDWATVSDETEELPDPAAPDQYDRRAVEPDLRAALERLSA